MTTQLQQLREMSRRDVDHCVEWPYVIKKCGYGQVWYIDRPRTTHRTAWVDFHGTIPVGLQVMHTCNNKRCVNLRHLKLGTPLENTRAAYADGLITIQRAQQLPQTKLNEQQVREIRASAGRGVDLARQYGVCPASICLIRKRKNWSHVL